MPDGWSFAQAAAVPVAFLTAYYGLRRPGRPRTGRVGAGARRRRRRRHGGGAAGPASRAPRSTRTASTGKWARCCGLRPAGATTSRPPAPRLRGRSVPPPAAAASTSCSTRWPASSSTPRCGCCRRGGRFVEMGKTDIRDADDVARHVPGVRYRPFDLREAGPDRIARCWPSCWTCSSAACCTPLPVTAWDVRAARRRRSATCSQARHIGKIVLTMPPPGDPGRHRADHRRHRRRSAGWSPGTWSPSTACATCCWPAGAAPDAPGAAELRRRADRTRRRGHASPPATWPTATRWPRCWPPIPATTR